MKYSPEWGPVEDFDTRHRLLRAVDITDWGLRTGAIVRLDNRDLGEAPHLEPVFNQLLEWLDIVTPMGEMA